MRIGLYPNLGMLVLGLRGRRDRPLVTVIDHEVPLPEAPSLEIRTDGLWADHTVETPLEHFSLGLEAFGVGLDDPAEVYGELHGDRVPFGFDLEWETDGGVPLPDGSPATRCRASCTARSSSATRRIDFDGLGQRDHCWGVRDWWTLRWVLDRGLARRRHPLPHHKLRLPTWSSPRATSAARRRAPADRRCAAAEDLGPHGFPAKAAPRVWGPRPHYRAGCLLAGAALDTGGEPAGEPVSGALCRFKAGDGRTGVGWTEWNQTEAPPA